MTKKVTNSNKTNVFFLPQRFFYSLTQPSYSIVVEIPLIIMIVTSYIMKYKYYLSICIT